MRLGRVVVVAGLLAGAASTARAESAATSAQLGQASSTVARWLDAQNRGSFADYGALYAPTFQGVKRVGTTATSLSRTAWMADRQKMFRTRMTVTTTNLGVTVDSDQLIVELDQRWEQGVYADTGRKRIVISAASNLIVTEEMLTSRVLLTQSACRKLATATAGKVAEAAVLDLGENRALCRIDHPASPDVDGAVELVGMVRAKAWTEQGRVVVPIHDERPAGESFGTHDELAVTTIQLGTSVQPIVTVTSDRYDEEQQTVYTTNTSTLYSSGRATFARALTWSGSHAANNEGDDGTDCTLTAIGRHRPMPAVDLTCIEHVGDWWNEDRSKRGIHETTDVKHYVWSESTNTYVAQTP